jgi:hypothetical protein
MSLVINTCWKYIGTWENSYNTAVFILGHWAFLVGCWTFAFYLSPLPFTLYLF